MKVLRVLRVWKVGGGWWFFWRVDGGRCRVDTGRRRAWRAWGRVVCGQCGGVHVDGMDGVDGAWVVRGGACGAWMHTKKTKNRRPGNFYLYFRKGAKAQRVDAQRTGWRLIDGKGGRKREMLMSHVWREC